MREREREGEGGGGAERDRQKKTGGGVGGIPKSCLKYQKPETRTADTITRQ